MKRPRTDILIIGHPIVAVPFLLGGAIVLYGCWQGGNDGVLPGLAAAAVMALVAQANEQAAAYKRWKREWDGMADPAERPPSRHWLHAGVVIAIAIIVLACLAGQGTGDAAVLAGLGISLVLIAALVLAALRGLFSRRRRRARPHKAVPVTVVAKPLLKVPTMAAAYAALPEHCRQLMERRT